MADQPRSRESNRLISRLMAEHRTGRLVYGGVDIDGRYEVAVGGRDRRYDTAGMWAYLRGRAVGEDAGQPTAIAPGGLAAFRPALDDNADLPDQMRTQLRAAMAAADIGPDALAARIGRNRRAVRDALRWGPGTLMLRMAQEMIAGCGCRWVVYAVPDGEVARPVVLQQVGLAEVVVPEAPGVARMRLLDRAYAAGLVEAVAPDEPNEAYRARVVQVVAGGSAHRVRAAVLPAWLTGLADGRGE